MKMILGARAAARVVMCWLLVGSAACTRTSDSGAPMSDAAVATPASTGTQLRFGARTTLSGKLVQKDVLGLVNGAPKPLKVPFLVLDKNIDVLAGEGANAAEPAERQSEVQVGFEDLEKARPFFGKHVQVSGELSPQVTAHHYSPVVLVLAQVVP